MRAILGLGLLLLLALGTPGLAAVILVTDGQPRAAIVIPDKPSEVVTYAARELTAHLKLATGATLPIVPESQATGETRVYLGPTAAAGRAGLDPAKLAADSFILRTAPQAVYVVGRDSDGPPLSPDTWAGTLFGVYELLENTLGVRWLWPGELGTFVPKTNQVVVADTNQQVAPRLIIRRLRSTVRNWGSMVNDADTYSPAAMAQAQQDERVWLRRHRLGHSRKMRWGHAFTDWWDRYGKDHPDWFNLLEDGQRRPQGGSSASAGMCVSNPGLHRQIIENWLADCQASPDNKPNINGCENDVFGRCLCPDCKAWDAPRTDAALWPPRFSDHGIVSDRYTRFWRTLQELGARHDPDVIVAAYAYVNYAPPPVREKLNDHVWIGLVPDAFFPRTEAEHQQCLDMWQGWAKTGCKLFLRPNYTLEGYCMPFNYTHQFADEFAHHAQRGMIATDFDSLTAMWATQGPQQYLFARWQTCLDAPVEQVLAEYYSGFGPAAKAVQAYFDYWEKFTMGRREFLREAEKQHNAGWSSFARIAHEIFPPEAFAEGDKLLAAARQAAGTDTQAQARVEFLSQGLTHARLCAQVAEARARRSFLDSQKAIGTLRQYRRQIEKNNVANLAYCAWIEARSWGTIPRQVLYEGEKLAPLTETVAPADLKPISLRNEHGVLALLKAGDTFRCRIEARKVGARTEPITWTLAENGQTQVAFGTVALNTTEELKIPVPRAGFYNLIVGTSGSAVGLTPLNDHAVLLGQSLGMMGESGPLFFHVPPGTRHFRLTLTSPAPGETASLEIIAPDGQVLASGGTGDRDKFVAEITVPAGLDGKAWQARLGKAPTGVLEDYTLLTDENIPPYWALAADRLLVLNK